MARIRTIKPDIWTDEKFVELSTSARLLFIGLWNFADDEGRMPYSPKQIKLRILPADTVDAAALLAEMEALGLIIVYVADGEKLLQIKGFTKHQKVDRPNPSRLPPPPNSSSAREDSTKDREPSRKIPPEGKGREKEEDTKVAAEPSPAREAAPRFGIIQDKADRLLAIIGADASKSPGWAATLDLQRWLLQGADYDLDIAPAIEACIAKRKANGEGPPSGWRYFEKPIAEARQRRLAGLPAVPIGKGRSADASIDRFIDAAERRDKREAERKPTVTEPISRERHNAILAKIAATVGAKKIPA